MIFDTHAHYDDKQFDADRDALLLGMRQKNVGTILNVGASLDGCRKSIELAGQYPFVYAAVGIHPEEIGVLDEASFSWLRESAATNEKVVAIGEIGLDYHWETFSRTQQKEWFIRQLDLAAELHLPVSIHSREAAQDTVDILKGYAGRIEGSIHCFSYSPEIAKVMMGFGFHLGIGGVLTFKNAKKLKEIVREMPMERMLLETDCPYLAPSPHRGERNDSSLIDLVAHEVARIKEIPVEEVIEKTQENAVSLFLKGIKSEQGLD